MYGLIFNVVLSALSTVVAGYMQINGYGTPDLIAAIAAVAGGNGAMAVKKGADMRKENAERKQAHEIVPPLPVINKAEGPDHLNVMRNHYDDRA